MTRNEPTLTVLRKTLPPEFLPGAGEALSRDRFFRQFGSAGRLCGDGPWVMPLGQGERGAQGGWLWEGLSRDDAGRVALLIDADARLSPAAMYELAEDCFRHGDNSERRATLRALSLFAEPTRYVELGAQACRSHVQTVFESLACENPFPAKYFAELQFNQMVLKALFIGASLGRVMGLAARVTPELARMAGDYADERRAAGRSVPHDIEAFILPAC